MSLLMVHCFGTIQERFDAQDEASLPRESRPAAEAPADVAAGQLFLGEDARSSASNRS